MGNFLIMKHRLFFYALLALLIYGSVVVVVNANKQPIKTKQYEQGD